MNNSIFVKYLIVVLVFSFGLSSCWDKEEKTDESLTGVTIQEEAITDTSENKTEETEDKASLSEKFLSNSAWNIKCSMTIEDWSWKIDQTVYISGKKMRMDSNWNDDWISIDNHMISDGEYNYMWWNTGSFKMKIPKNDVSENEKTNVWYTDSNEVLDKIPENKCEDWNVDSTVFDIPSGIEFVDLEEMQKSIKMNIPDMPQ